MKYRPKHLIEYMALRAAAGLVNILPYRVALSIGWALGWIAFHVVRYRREEAIRRIRSVLGEDTTREKATCIAWICMRNMGFHAVEVLRLAKPTAARTARLVDTAAVEKFLALWGRKGGGILALAHMGNWNIAALAANSHDLPLFSIFAVQKNPLVNQYIIDLRDKTGTPGIPRTARSIGKDVLRRLKHGKVLAILIDLRSRTPALRVRFLGKDANIAGGMGAFSRAARVPVFPAVLRREGWTRHVWDIHEPVYPDPAVDRQHDALRITQYCMDIFDAAVREHPEQYFWYNKRWVLDPVDEMAGPEASNDQRLTDPPGEQMVDDSGGEKPPGEGASVRGKRNAVPRPGP